jgi:hypothetical protein
LIGSAGAFGNFSTRQSGAAKFDRMVKVVQPSSTEWSKWCSQVRPNGQSGAAKFDQMVKVVQPSSTKWSNLIVAKVRMVPNQ